MRWKPESQLQGKVIKELQYYPQVYNWTDYITREDLPEVHNKYFTDLIQVTMDNRGQGEIDGT